MQFQTKQAGLTLHELMVGLSIIAILLAMAAPSYSEFVSKRRLAGASNLIAMYFEDIKMLSIKHNEFISISLQNSADGKQWCMGATAGNGASCDCMAVTPQCLVHSEASLITNTTYPEFRDVTATFAGGNLTFDPVRGILTNPAESLLIRVQHVSDEYQVNISINATGTVRKCSPAGYQLVGYPTCI